jgi:hypothetical protein
VQRLNARLNFEKFTEFLKFTISSPCGVQNWLALLCTRDFPVGGRRWATVDGKHRCKQVGTGKFTAWCCTDVIQWKAGVVLSLAHHEGVWGSRVITTFAPNLATIWKLVACLTPLPLYPRTRTPTARQMRNKVGLGFCKGGKSHSLT